MQRALDRMLAAVGGAGKPKPPETVDSETAERLQALGYVGGSVSARHLEDSRVATRRTRSSSLQPAEAGEHRIGGRALRRSDREGAPGPRRPDPRGRCRAGNFLERAARHDEAIAAYKKALALDPEHRESPSGSRAYKEQGRLADARTGFERARSTENGRVLWQLADLEMR
jgi:tetratricopeptide (TPR) repeat protein